jgi:hypothetical protein
VEVEGGGIALDRNKRSGKKIWRKSFSLFSLSKPKVRLLSLSPTLERYINMHEYIFM